MKKIIKLEDPFIIKFLKSIKKQDYLGFPDNISIGKSPDYYLPEVKYLVEIKRVFDRDELEKWAIWESIFNKFNKVLDVAIKNYRIEGTYLINTPERLKMPMNKKFYMDSTKIILEAVTKNKRSVTVNGYGFEIHKVNKKGSYIAFSSIGIGGSVNIAGIVYKNIREKLKTANAQLGFKYNDPDKKIVLLVNQYRLLSWDWELFEGISFAYNDLLSYENIDEVWIQSGEKHTLLFDRNLFEQFEASKFLNTTKNQFELFAKWFSPLDKMGEEKKGKLIEALKVFLKDKKPFEIFPDIYTRIEMVRFGRWLAENNRLGEASWLIGQFLSDPDPLDPPTENKKDFGNELHEKIKKATKPDIHSINTVKGHLAWTVQLLALRKDFLKEAYGFTQRELRKTKHLYLIMQWIVPLIEISNRRFLLKELDEGLYSDFKKLCFELLNSYSQFPDIAIALVHVFNYFKNLTTNEAKEVLDKLEKADDYQVLLLYYAIFRDRHFKEAKYPKDVRSYNPAYAKEKLEKTILNNEPSLLNLRSSLAWNIWKILSEDEKEFKTLSPLIDKFLSTPYDNHLYHNFERIVEDHIEKHTSKSIDWFMKVIDATNEYLKLNPDKGREVWLGTGTTKVLSNIARAQPQKLSILIELLFEIWMKGAYIGSISETFTSYESIADAGLRLEMKDKFRDLYSKMKLVNEKLEPVDWK